MEAVYKFLAGIGYDHPLHAPLAHMPTGLAVGALLFLTAAFITRRYGMRTTAFHCSVMALIFAVPTALLGLADWQHYYACAWLHPIKMKLWLTAVLLVLLAFGIAVGARTRTGYAALFITYLLIVATVSALGFYGANLVYTEKSPAAALFKQGEKLYAANCGGCHPNGGNTITPDLPVLNSPQLKDTETFTKFNRNPTKPDGTRGTMPAFPKEKLSDEDMIQIYQYVTAVLAKQGK